MKKLLFLIVFSSGVLADKPTEQVLRLHAQANGGSHNTNSTFVIEQRSELSPLAVTSESWGKRLGKSYTQPPHIKKHYSGADITAKNWLAVSSNKQG